MHTLKLAADYDDAADQDLDHADNLNERIAKPARTAGARKGVVTRALDSTICCLCLLLLSPAIVAVWIAIRRSAQPIPATSSRARRPSESLASASAAPVRIVLKPERMHLVGASRTNSLTEPSLAAQAAI